MTDQPPPARGGAAGMLTLFAVVVFAIGLGFDLTLSNARAFWIGAEQGARALIAVGAVVAVVAAGRLLRVVLGRGSGDTHGRD